MPNTIKTAYPMRLLALIVGLSLVTLPALAAKISNQRTFASPEDAVSALADSARKGDTVMIRAILGPASHDLDSGDTARSRRERENFIAAFDTRHALVDDAAGRKILNVGKDDWPFPIPLVKKPGGWVFDTAAGKEEILNRRIGQNELHTIQTMLALVDAQREYALTDRDGDRRPEYAQKLLSSPGKKDGLYWPTPDGTPPSPLGNLLAEASKQGYPIGSGKPSPYWGYYFRILTAQGKSAKDGAYSYLVNGRMIGGFAILAYPADYGKSGVMSFVVNHDGVVLQKNLGNDTAKKAVEIKTFNPDASWSEAARAR